MWYNNISEKYATFVLIIFVLNTKQNDDHKETTFKL